MKKGILKMKLALLLAIASFAVHNINAQDVTPPDSVLPEVLSQTETSFTVSLTAKDSVGVVGYYILSYDKQDTIKNILGDTVVTTVNGLVNDSLNIFWAVAYDATGNKSNEEPIGVLIGKDDSKFYWANDNRITTTRKTPGDSVFTVKFSVIATSELVDAAVAICKRKVAHQDDWNAHAIIFKLNYSGVLQCRNGNSYMADSTVYYTIGDKFDVRFVINPTDTIYDCWVSKNGGNEILLADNYYFRDKQNYAQLKDIAYRYVNAPVVVSNVNWDVKPTLPDTTPPDSLLPEVLNQTETSFTVSLTAKDSVGVVGYYILSYDKQDTIKNILGDTVVTTVNGLVNDSLNVFWAVAYDAAGNKSTEEPIGVLVDEDDSKNYWANDNRITTTRKILGDSVFTVKFSIIATGDNADAYVAICQRKVTFEHDYNAHACIFRLNGLGNLDCRDNNGYMKESIITYIVGDRFDVRFVINPTDTIYDCWVSKNGGDEILLADDYYFRNKLNYTTQLKNIAYRHVNAPVVVSNVKWDVKPTLPDITPPDSVLPEVLSQTETSFTVSLTAKDSVGVVGYYILSYDKQDTIKNILGDTVVTTVNGLVNDSLNIFWAVAYDAAGNKSTEEPIGILVGEDDSKFYWANDNRVTTTRKIPGDDIFMVKFSMTAINNLANTAVAICKREVAHQDDWNAHAIIFRLNYSGVLDCRNGNSYMADSTVYYTIGDKFDVRFVINPTDTIYDCWVSKNGENEILLADDYYFRDKQNYTQLKDIAYRHVGSPAIVSDIEWDADIEIPSMPIGLISSNVTASSVKLTWNASTDNRGVKGYNINYASNDIYVADTIAIINGLTPLTQYSFTITALDYSDNESEQSVSHDVVTLADLTAPSVPSGLVSSNITTSSVALTWNSCTDNVSVVSYKIYSSGSYSNSSADTTINLTGLSYSTQYSFTISAVDNTGNESLQSSAILVTTETPVDTQPPSVPGKPYAVYINNNNLMLNWIASTDNVKVTGYKVYTNGINPFFVTHAGYLLLTDLDYDTQYTFTLSALDAVGNESEQSAGLDFFVSSDTIAPSVPTNLTSSFVTNSSMTLAWNMSTDNKGVTGYKVYINGVCSDSTKIESIKLDNLNSEIQYSFTVTAVDLVGNESAQSVPLQVPNIKLGTGSSIVSKIKIYPNPLNSFKELKIDMGSINTEGVIISMNNSVGQLVYVKSLIASNSFITIPTQSFANGVYILSIKSKDNILRQEKIIIY